MVRAGALSDTGGLEEVVGVGSVAGGATGKGTVEEGLVVGLPVGLPAGLPVGAVYGSCVLLRVTGTGLTLEADVPRPRVADQLTTPTRTTRPTDRRRTERLRRRGHRVDGVVAVDDEGQAPSTGGPADRSAWDRGGSAPTPDWRERRAASAMAASARVSGSCSESSPVPCARKVCLRYRSALGGSCADFNTAVAHHASAGRPMGPCSSTSQ